VLEKDVKVGGFVEIKKTRVGSKTKIAHLSYIGDAQLGSGINMGGGTIVVNYDGKRKNLTTIHDNAFIGCNCNLVAPVTVGKGAYVAAGSTVTEDVPAGSLTIARAHQVNKEGRAARYLENNNSKNMNRKE
jgi:bifunctional UDP-N-acetylglucosamine pyrophosphorylase/glucosamine-1-phosphate N-acetyltransferase